MSDKKDNIGDAIESAENTIAFFQKMVKDLKGDNVEKKYRAIFTVYAFDQYCAKQLMIDLENVVKEQANKLFN